MKKTLSILLVFVLVLGFSLMNVTSTANARRLDIVPIPVTPKSPDLADGAWDSGAELVVDMAANPAPTWLQMMTNGVKVSGAAEICHPFRGGQFGWVGEIRELKDGKWVKLTTTNGWVPNTEGVYLSCAQAPEAGIYALFAYNGTISNDPPPANVDPLAYCASLGEDYMYDSELNACVNRPRYD